MVWLPSEMGKTEVIEIPPSPPVKMGEDGTPLRPIFCLKNKADMKLVEEIDDCFILDFDPEDSIGVTKLSSEVDEDDGLAVVAEKGQVACRDYPHSRHLCGKFPFETTPHESYCVLCYCYVCDSTAPCKNWSATGRAHCDATEDIGHWKFERLLRKTSKLDEK